MQLLKSVLRVAVLVPIFFSFSCAYSQYRPHSALDQLSIGMPVGQVTQIMGQPKQVVPLSNGGSSYRYELFTPFRGTEPYDIVFDNSDRLTGYYRNDEEFYRKQKMMQTQANSFVNHMQKDRELDIKQQRVDNQTTTAILGRPLIYVDGDAN